MAEDGYTILYKCKRCGTVSQKLRLSCDYCGHRFTYDREAVKGAKNGRNKE